MKNKQAIASNTTTINVDSDSIVQQSTLDANRVAMHMVIENSLKATKDTPITYSKLEKIKYKVWAKIVPWLYISPFLIAILVFSVYPIFNTLFMSFKEDYNYINGDYSGIGFGNYEDLFDNRFFIQAIGNTLTYVVLVVPITLAFAILFASMLNKQMKGKALFQTAFFLPLVTSSIAIGYVWQFIFSGNGLINWFVGLFGAESIPWLTSSKYSMFVLVSYGVWNGIPFATMILLSNMQRINKRYYTSARMDNASSWQQFKKITLPMMIPTILVLAVLNMLSSLKVFNDVFVLFNGEPGPFSNLYTLVYFVYQNLQGGGSRGTAAAVAILLMMIAFIGAIVVFALRNFRKINFTKIFKRREKLNGITSTLDTQQQ
ncbi:MAG: sugar ABC transporter permease [Firmicutes bacterium]|nr:sugar ABC transporter permease [Bacillota bacterium]MCL1954022.1 sugar ABC transporter permease [Bacillota bacterium]